MCLVGKWGIDGLTRYLSEYTGLIRVWVRVQRGGGVLETGSGPKMAIYGSTRGKTPCELRTSKHVMIYKITMTSKIREKYVMTFDLFPEYFLPTKHS